MDFRESLNRIYFDMTVSAFRRARADRSEALSYSTVMYLDIIAYRPDLTVSDLARLLNLSKPAVTMKVGEMVRAGQVVKTQSSSDRRVFHLRLSEEVQRRMREYDDAPFERAVGRIEREYSAEQLGDFCDILQIFSEEYRRET